MSTSGISSVLTNVNNAFSGKTSGIDVASTVSSLMQLQRAPEDQLKSQQDTITTQLGLLQSINSDLTSLYTSVNDLKDVFGALSQKDVASTDSTIVTASAAYTAPIGIHAITVKQLATVSSCYSDPITDPSLLASSEINVAYGDPANPIRIDRIKLPSGISSLQQAADTINTSADNTGITASVLNDTSGQRLTLVSRSSGQAGNLTVTASSAFHQGAAGEDASLIVDGVPVTSASNTVSGALAGITLNLSKAAPNQPVQLTVAADTALAATAVGNFVNACNTAMKAINAQYTVDSSGNEGPLVGDTSLRTLQSQLLDAVTYSIGGTGQYVNLQSMGVEMQNDGTLQINSTALNDALTAHYSDFQNFFQSLSPEGFGQHVGNLLLQVTDPTNGTISLDVTGLQSTSNGLTDQINAFEDHMTIVQQQLMEQYSLLNVLLQQYPSQIQQINTQLAALPGSSKG